MMMKILSRNLFPSELEKLIEDQQGIKAIEFLKKMGMAQKHNYEIAEILSCTLGSVTGLKRKLHLPIRTNTTGRKLDERHGPGSMDIFLAMIRDKNTTLSDIAKHFGFTRAHASYIYQQYFGEKYTDKLQKQKTEARYNVYLRSRSSYRVAAQVQKKMKSQDLEVEIFRTKSGRNLLRIKNIVICPRIMVPKQVGNCFYHCFLNTSFDFVQFIVAIIPESQIYFVLPHIILPMSRISIPYKYSRSKYSKFIDRWDLIRNKQNENA